MSSTPRDGVFSASRIFSPQASSPSRAGVRASSMFLPPGLTRREPDEINVPGRGLGGRAGEEQSSISRFCGCVALLTWKLKKRAGSLRPFRRRIVSLPVLLCFAVLQVLRYRTALAAWISRVLPPPPYDDAAFFVFPDGEMLHHQRAVGILRVVEGAYARTICHHGQESAGAM